MKYIRQSILLQLLCVSVVFCTAQKSLFKVYIDKEIRSNYYGDILISKEGPILISCSQYSFVIITGGNIGSFTIGLDNQDYGIKNLENVFSGVPVKALTESSDNYIFFSTAKNQITYFQNSEKGICDLPPFYFPIKGDSQQNITTLWFDKENNLYIGAANNAFYMVPKAGIDQSLNPKNYKIGKTADGKMLIEKENCLFKKFLWDLVSVFMLLQKI